jgi:hypothetical protein
LERLRERAAVAETKANAAAAAVEQAQTRQAEAVAHMDAIKEELAELEATAATAAELERPRAAPPTPDGLEETTRKLLEALEKAPLVNCPESALSAMQTLHGMFQTAEAAEQEFEDARQGLASDGGDVEGAADARGGLDGEELDTHEMDAVEEIELHAGPDESDAQLGARLRELMNKKRPATSGGQPVAIRAKRST